MRGDMKAGVQSWSGKTRILGEAAHQSKDAVDVVSFNFQKNLPTPTLHHNDVFYTHQLWTYNFGSNDCVSGWGYMYMWDKTLAKRRSSETASCLHHFLSTYKTGAKSGFIFRWLWRPEQESHHRWLVQWALQDRCVRCYLVWLWASCWDNKGYYVCGRAAGIYADFFIKTLLNFPPQTLFWTSHTGGYSLSLYNLCNKIFGRWRELFEIPESICSKKFSTKFHPKAALWLILPTPIAQYTQSNAA